MTPPTPTPGTLCEAFQHTAAIDPDSVGLRTVGDSRTLTWQTLAEEVRLMAAGLSRLGVRRGDAVALMMSNRIDFYPIDIAAQHLGATPFSVYNTLPANQIGQVLHNSGATVVLCEAQYVDTLRASGAAVQHLVIVDGRVDNALTLDDVRAFGQANSTFDFEGTWRAVQPNDVLTLIYTSGTTGDPKGVEITHGNMLAQATGVSQVLDFRFGDRITSYLPSAHIADRFTGLYAHEIFGTQITVVGDIKAIAQALPDCRPTIWGAVPRVWAKIRRAIEQAIDAEPDPAQRNALHDAVALRTRRAALVQAGEPVDENLAAADAKADATALAELRARLGLDQLRWAVSGAAPIPAEMLAFFLALGVPICEGWGISELSCFGALAAPANARFGSVGKLLPGLEGRHNPDGELLVRGASVMQGYRGDPERTREAIDDEGWFHTGDIFSIDADGYLRIVDRKKNLITTEAGKNIAPTNVESAIETAHPLISTVVAIGDNRPYITALLVLDAEAAAAYAAERDLDPAPETLSRAPQLIEELKEGIVQRNAVLARVEQVKRFRILPRFWECDSDELTSTMKLKRRNVTQKYAREIASLYNDPPGFDIINCRGDQVLR